MRLQHAFYKFPFRFDVERLRAEVLAIPEDRWQKHVQNFKGNAHLPLISTLGGMNEDFERPMQPTEVLSQLPYVTQIFARFQTLHGRARLMRLEPGHGVPPHFDMQHYWRTHTRVHIPIITDPDIRFHCGDESVHMQAGEAWTFDNWRMHSVVNETSTRRVHLTFDTYGSAAFWAMARPHATEQTPQFVAFDPNAKPRLTYESYIGDAVMSPAEFDLEMSRLLADIAAAPVNDRDATARLRALIADISRAWRDLWFEIGPAENWSKFNALMLDAARDIKALQPPELILSSNGQPASESLVSTVTAMVTPRRATAKPVQTARAAQSSTRLDRPVFIIAAPRSGSTLLFESLAKNEALWSLGGEGHAHVEKIPALSPRARGFDSNRLTDEDVTPEISETLRAAYAASLHNSKGKAYTSVSDAPDRVRFLEKTPKNSLRVPFFKSLFPDAKFIFLHREAQPNISAIMDAWQSTRFVTYPGLPGWSGPAWSLLLIPGWRDLVDHDLAEIAMRQWRDTNDIIMNDLAELPVQDWCSVRYEDLIAGSERTLQRLCTFAEVPYDASTRAVAEAPLRPSLYTLTQPAPEKWRKNEAAIAPFFDAARATIDRLAKFGNAGADISVAAQ